MKKTTTETGPAEAPMETSGFAESPIVAPAVPAAPAASATDDAPLPMPEHGGSFIRQPDGSLTLVQED